MLTRKQAEDLTREIKTGLQDLHKKIDRAYEGQADVALGYSSWAEYCKANIWLPNLDRMERKGVVKALYGDGKKMTHVEVGEAVGISERTVRSDLRAAKLPDVDQPRRAPRSPRKLSDDDWETAEACLRAGESFRSVAKNLGVSSSVLSRDRRLREAKAEFDPYFNHQLSEIHSENSVACELETPGELIHDIQRQVNRVLNPAVYTLSEIDIHRLEKVLSEGLTETQQRKRNG